MLASPPVIDSGTDRILATLINVKKTPLLFRLWSSVWVVGCVALIPYLIAVAHCLIKFARTGRTGNLPSFRDAAIALSHGQNIYQSGVGDYVYPPLIAFLAQPLGWISIHWAAVFMLAVNTIVALLTLKIICEESLFRLTGRATPIMVARVALITAWLTTDHIRTEFDEWETNIWMLFMFVLALRWADRRPVWAGMALGFAFNIKFLPIVFVPYLIIRRRWVVLLAFAASVLLFSFLPVISMGWNRDLAALLQSYSGIARLLGIHVAKAGSANVNPFTSDKSVSIPSFLGRATGLPEPYVMTIAGGIGTVLLIIWALFYQLNGIRLFRWGPSWRQMSHPYRGLFALEWAAIILLALLFSPYTNSAHLYLLLAINAVASVLLLYGTNGLNRWPLLVAALAMFLGTVLPPGGGHFRHAQLLWSQLGVCAWCMCILFITLTWTGTKHIRKVKPEGAG
jgi:Glycosyltransferase family 87